RDDLDLRVLERRVEFVHLPRVEGELVERECDLLRVEPSYRSARFEQRPRLVRVENVLAGPTRARPTIRCAQTAPLVRRITHARRRVGARQRVRKTGLSAFVPCV